MSIVRCEWCGHMQDAPPAEEKPNALAGLVWTAPGTVGTIAQALDAAQGNRYGEHAAEEWAVESQAVAEALAAAGFLAYHPTADTSVPPQDGTW